MKEVIKLRNIPKESKIKLSDDLIATFHHLDGMYSYCTFPDGSTVNFRGSMPVREVEDGLYEVINED